MACCSVMRSISFIPVLLVKSKTVDLIAPTTSSGVVKVVYVRVLELGSEKNKERDILSCGKSSEKVTVLAIG